VDDREQQRKVKHRLAVIRHAQEVTGNVAATCRYYGDFYNFSRPHGGLGGQTPYERLRTKATTRAAK